MTFQLRDSEEEIDRPREIWDKTVRIEQMQIMKVKNLAYQTHESTRTIAGKDNIVD